MPAAPGSGAPPLISNLVSTCSVSGTTGSSLVTFDVSKGIAGVSCSVTITLDSDAQQTAVWSGGIGTSSNAKSFTVAPPLANGSYTITADNTEVSVTQALVVNCTPASGGGSGGGGGSSCTLTLTVLSTTAPTTTGGWGELTYRIGGAADSDQYGTILRVSDGYQVKAVVPSGNGDYVAAIPPAGVGVPLSFTVYEDATPTAATCRATATFTVPAFTGAPDPSLGEPAQWQPVGGVLPNPIGLKVTATLTDAQNQPRVGLHAQVELWRVGATAAFASFRATVRSFTQYVDAAPYLRAELRAVQDYQLPNGPLPFIDFNAGLRFTYRFRINDRAGLGPWLTRAGERYAVLAALPEAADTMAPYVADGSGRVASVFPSGEAVQFVGYPLEATVLLPPSRASRWVEWRYLDAYGNEVEIRSVQLSDALPPGVLRLPLPNDPPLCAASVEVAIVDTDRHYTGDCGHVLPPPAPSTQGTYADPLYGFY